MNKGFLLILTVLASINSFADGCSGTASFTATYDSTLCCWSFQNTTNNDCSQWNCSWDFGDGSPIVTTPQGQGTTCHYYANPGSYVVTLIFDSSPCHGGGGGICYGNQTVTIPPLSVNSSTSNFIIDNINYNISCEGGDDGWIKIDSGSGYLFEWLTNPPQYTDSIGNLSAGTYTCNISNNGCIGVFDITLTEPSIHFNEFISPSCFDFSNGNITINPSGGLAPFTYLWNNGSTTNSLSSLDTGSYSVQIIDSLGCIDSATYIMTEYTALSILDSLSLTNGYNVSCFNGSDGYIDLTVSGSVPNYTYLWSNGETTEDLNNIAAGFFSVTVTDQVGCTAVDTIEITEPILNVIENINHVVCNGGVDGSVQINVNGSSSPYYIFWSNNIDINNLATGTYTYQIVDFIGCTYDDSISILQPDSFNVTQNIIDVSCFGENNGTISLNVSGSTPPYVIDWFGANTNNLFAGTYNFTITDSNNCPYSEIAIVSEPNPIDVLCQIIDPSCGNTNDGSVQLTISGGIPNYYVNWGNINPNALSIGTYNYVVNDANNCSDSNSVSLVAESNIQVVSSVNNISCNSFCDGSIDLQINGGVTPYNIDWFGYNANTLCEGLFYYEILDNIGCTYTDSFNISMPDSVSLIITQNAMQLIANASGGTPPYSYQWYDDNSSLNSGPITNITTNGNYYCIAIDSNNCQSDTINYFYSETFINEGDISSVDIFPNPTLNSVSIQFLCNENQSISIYLTDLLGRKILIDSRFNFIGKYKNKINLSSYSNGMYLINIQTNNQNLVKKIIKK